MTKESRAYGRLIVIDGIDQSGKKTQTDWLIKKIREHGFHCVRWDFPVYHTRIGRHLKAYLTRKEQVNLHVAHLLYAANKWEVAASIEKQLRRGYIVVANRYTPSNLVYGVAHNLPQNWLYSLEADLPKPSCVIILDISPSTSFNRKQRDRDAHEVDLQYLERVRRLYRKMSKKYHWKIIDGRPPQQETSFKIWDAIIPILKSVGASHSKYDLNQNPNNF